MCNVTISCVPSNDTWARDYGPITVIEKGTPILLNFGFNGWGGKYPCNLDKRIIQRLNDAGTFGESLFSKIAFILEGGSIDCDGDGALLTTTQCLLASSRNPGYGKRDIEYLLSSVLGIRRIIWLEHGRIIGDDTDGHIDMLARFCDRQTIAYAACDEPSDEHFSDLQAMKAELGSLRTIDNKAYRLVPLPLPAPVVNSSGFRLPASYANFLIINRAVLVPLYDDPADTVALTNLAGCFPDREIIGIPCRPLILQHGSLHCVTMQLPAGVLQ
jgi:agmatine/peptidylarginine deiminase